MKLSSIFILVGLAGIVHQKIIGGGWFNWSQVLELKLHHEHLILLCFIIAFLIAVRNRLPKRLIKRGILPY